MRGSAEIPIHSLSVYILLVVFAATLIRSTFGFGEALVAVPLLSLRMPLRTAAPLAVLVSIAVAALILGQDWRQVHVRSAGGLVASTVFGIPLGLWLLRGPHQQGIKAALAVLILGFAIYSLAGRKPPEIRTANRVWMAGCGFIAGVLGGAYGMNGPPLVIYGNMCRWTPAHFRATLQGYFFPASLAGMAGYVLAGLWTAAVTHDFLLCLPVIVLGVLLGRYWNRRIHGAVFQRLVYVGVAASGLLLLAQALRA
jgi:uncharacterized membrane protein YfcA